ncbi:MAG TPA: YncE family protein [Candidatus Nitrosocosmicus sp.]
MIGTINVGSNPQGVAYNSGNGDVYVTNLSDGTVSVINSTNKVVATINAGPQPQGVAFNSGNGDVYVTNGNFGTVSVINSTNKVVATINVGNPHNIAYDSGNGDVYVTNGFSNTVSVINSTNQVVATINVGHSPQGVAYNSDNHYVYVANSGSNTVSVIDTTVLPTGTTITSAAGGNGQPITNGGFTLSTSITFRVQTTAGSNPIAGFQCSLDGGSFSNCNANNQNEITFNNLAAGPHTVKIRAVDSQGNVDLTHASFSWFVMQQSPSNNTTSTGGFGGHGGDSVATTGSTNGGHGGNGGADGKYLMK